MSTIPHKLCPAVFRKAAILLSEGAEFACPAISKAADDTTHSETPERVFFQAVLKPEGVEHWEGWYDRCYHEADYAYNKRNARVFGLLLCALLVEDGWTL